MVKKRIVSVLTTLFFTTPLLDVDAIQVQSEPMQITDSVEKINSRDSKIEQVEEIVRVEIKKNKVIEAEKEAKRQKDLEEEQNKLNEIKKKEEARQAQEVESKKQYWKFEVSYYCGCYACTQNGNLQTASGAYAQEGVTVALPGDIPFGTQVHIENVGNFINQDVGGFIQYTYDNEGNTVMRIDVFISDHTRALELGRHIESGYIILE